MVNPLRWGIAGAGLISEDFVNVLKTLPENHHRVVAVAARSLQSAKDFANKLGIQKSYGCYSDLATDPEIDVVYVGVLHIAHHDIAIDILRNKKPVLCEKPMCMNVRETEEVVQMALQKNVFLMEGIWSRFFPAYIELERRIKVGVIGEVRHVTASFGKCYSYGWMSKKETGGGTTLAMGIYPIQLVTLAMGGVRPKKVVAVGHLNEEGVDETISASLLYSDGRAASISASFKIDYPCEAHIIGTEGALKLPFPMWCPEKLEGPMENFTSYLPVSEIPFNYLNSMGLMYEAEEVRRCLNEGFLESPRMTFEDSIIVAEIMQEIRTQVGTSYYQDD